MKKLYSFIKTLFILTLTIVLVQRFLPMGALSFVLSAESFSQELNAAVHRFLPSFTAEWLNEEPAEFYGEVGSPAAEPTTAESSPSLPSDDKTEHFPAVYYPYRAMLDAAEMHAYDLLYENAINLQKDTVLKQPLTIEQMERAVSAVLYDHPELFWLDSSYTYISDHRKMVQEITLHFNDTAKNIGNAQAAFDSALSSLVTNAAQFDSPIEQEKYVHDVLLQTVEYNENAPLNQSAYSALVLGESVCAGYSRAFQLAMQRLGIPCYYCTGYAEEDHAWNIIRLADSCYNIDLSWNDPVGNTNGTLYYDYFNVSDEQIGIDHERTGLSVNLPACTSDEFSYISLYGRNAPGLRTELYTLKELGYGVALVCATLEEYYDQSRNFLRTDGIGTHTHTLILQNDALYRQVAYALDSKASFDNIVIPCAERLKLNGYSAQIELDALTTREGFVILNQTITLMPQ